MNTVKLHCSPFLSWYGSILALGLEATTPPAAPDASPAEIKAAAAAAREQIEIDTNRLYNFGAYDGDVHFTHDRFAYIITDEARLTHALENIGIFEENLHKRSLPIEQRKLVHSSVSAHRQQARQLFQAIPRENFLVGQNLRRAAHAHNVDTGGSRVLREDALCD